MHQTLRKYVALPEIPARHLAAAGTLIGFGWLLLQDQIPPLTIYLLELYLTF